jgi:hypothetical protein
VKAYLFLRADFFGDRAHEGAAVAPGDLFKGRFHPAGDVAFATSILGDAVAMVPELSSLAAPVLAAARNIARVPNARVRVKAVRQRPAADDAILALFREWIAAYAEADALIANKAHSYTDKDMAVPLDRAQAAEDRILRSRPAVQSASPLKAILPRSSCAGTIGTRRTPAALSEE